MRQDSSNKSFCRPAVAQSLENDIDAQINTEVETSGERITTEAILNQETEATQNPDEEAGITANPDTETTLNQDKEAETTANPDTETTPSPVTAETLNPEDAQSRSTEMRDAVTTVSPDLPESTSALLPELKGSGSSEANNNLEQVDPIVTVLQNNASSAEVP
jgi:hypothetical protein